MFSVAELCRLTGINSYFGNYMKYWNISNSIKKLKMRYIIEPLHYVLTGLFSHIFVLLLLNAGQIAALCGITLCEIKTEIELKII